MWNKLWHVKTIVRRGKGVEATLPPPHYFYISFIMPADRPSSFLNMLVYTEDGAKMFEYGSNGAAGLDIFSYSHTYVLKGFRQIVYSRCKAEILVF